MTPNTFPTPSGALICTAGPSISEKEISYVTDAITNCWDARCYEYIQKLEVKMAEYCKTEFAIATGSCTGGLHLSLWALGIGPGDEVIVPDMTWVASAAPITYVGATPVFVDIEKDSWCIAAEAIEKAITPNTKAIIAVHTYGHPADMDAINALAKNRGIIVIEDAAPSLGSTYNGKRTGDLSDVGVFSFHGSKIAVAGEGGAICTNNKELHDAIRVIGNHGRDGGRILTAARWGTKYNMSNLQAAFALAQVERMDELLEKKRMNYEWYKCELEGIEGLQLSTERPGVSSNCWQTSFVMEKDFGISQDDLMVKLKDVGIDSRPFFPPLSRLPMVDQDLHEQNPVAYFVGDRGLNLPSRHDLTEEDVQYIGKELRRILQKA
ncbi:glutamine--scyllo-inositol aminotransferase [Candidatus Peregrinibacteria bacterium CG10_big_fil_rev_8_21_14_0_10_49_10]|nr:MAG: glutamine--scyllo-inositol aminotransferase [Candidatus Peregrinibacteria bacterium CG10_big_fil_rev_8_21_14_0_10_49_10]